MNKLQKIFKKKKNIIIGVIHFPPLLGYKKFPGFKIAFKNAIADLKAFKKGEVDGIFIENNYDIPHQPMVGPEIISSLTYLGLKIKEATKLPLGISVLWNDYQAALAIAKTLNLQFIRIPVFVDKIQTDCGIIQGRPKEVLAYQKKIKGENVALFTDIHVKHSKLLSKYNIIQSAKMAIKNNSDAIIITGNWTGDAPTKTDLKRVRQAIGDFPILIGSGGNKNNIHNIFKYANGAIISTSLKKGIGKEDEINVKGYEQRIDVKKVKNLTAVIKYMK